MGGRVLSSALECGEKGGMLLPGPGPYARPQHSTRSTPPALPSPASYTQGQASEDAKALVPLHS